MTLKRFGISVAILLASTIVQAQQTKPEDKTPQPAVAKAPVSLTNQLRNTVGFLGVIYANHRKQIVGTCFFVYYPDDRLGKDRGFAYLVTNRHMAMPEIETGTPQPVDEAIVRLNLKSTQNGKESVEVPIDPIVRWHFPEDPSVDLAVVDLAPSQDIFDFQMIPISLIATKEVIQSSGVSPGDGVVFAGYFYQWAGTKRIQPIIRQGVLAMMPDEEVDTTLRKPGHIYFADAHAFHGNSGSPMFVNTGGIRGNMIGVGSYFLLGIVSGYFAEGVNFSLPAATVLTGEVHDNSGITTVVPAYQLRDLLESSELKAERDGMVAVEKNQKN
jgi:Trypsin-like peptidase domain